MIQSYLQFEIYHQVYAIHVEAVSAVMREVAISRIPWSPPAILGIAQKRGKIITVLDLYYLLGLNALRVEQYYNVLVLQCKGDSFGIIAKEFKGMVDIDSALIEMPLDQAEHKVHSGIAGFFYTDNHAVTILDSDMFYELQYQEGAL